ncbi:MAG: hypothetical protein AAF961_07810 [Planctomycetota bacterium]
MPSAEVSDTFIRFVSAAPHSLSKSNGDSTIADLKSALQAERLEDYSDFGFGDLDQIESEADRFCASTPLSQIVA